MNGMLLFKTNLLIMSYIFLKKCSYITDIFSCFYSLRDMGYTYSRGCSKKNSELRTRFFQLIKCIRSPSSILEKMWSKPEYCENRPANNEIKIY